MDELSDLERGDDESPWGGSWTDEKLGVLRDYLVAYLTALKKQRRYLRLGYIDAFAGAGYRKPRSSQEPELFALSAKEASAYRAGSARIALELDPGFDTYIFIEKSRARVSRLERLAAEFQSRDIRVLRGDANERLQALAALDWRGRRAVVFLDPYGMQLEWQTLEALAHTQAVDVWLLVPIAIATNRLLTRRLSDIPPGWARRLDRFFGTPDWRTDLYESAETLRAHRGLPLFSDETLSGSEREKVVGFDDIARYYLTRLASVFPHVAPNYKLLRTSRGQPLYMLCFAIANPDPKAKQVALSIAGHLLKS